MALPMLLPLLLAAGGGTTAYKLKRAAEKREQQAALDKEKRTLQTKAWDKAFTEAQTAGPDAVQQLLQSGMVPEWYPTAPQAAMAGISTPAEKLQGGLMNLITTGRATAPGTPTIPEIQAAQASGYFGEEGEEDTPERKPITLTDLIPPDIAERTTVQIGPSGLTATVAPPGALYSDSPVRQDDQGNDYVIRTYEDGQIARVTIPGKVGPTSTEKIAQREATLVVPVRTAQDGKEIEGPPMLFIPGVTQVPQGYEAFKPFNKSGVSVEVMNDLGKKMQGDLVGQLKDAQEIYTSIYTIEQGMKPEYFEYWQQAALGVSAGIEKYTPQWAEDLLRKTPFIGSRIPSDREVSAFASWRQLVDQYVFNWRKKITGVAGGEREMERIEGIAPNVDRDSYAQFKGKIEMLKAIHRAMYMRAKHYLETKSINLTELTPEDRKAKLMQNPIEGDLSLYIDDPTIRQQWAQGNLSDAARAFEAGRSK